MQSCNFAGHRLYTTTSEISQWNENEQSLKHKMETIKSWTKIDINNISTNIINKYTLNDGRIWAILMTERVWALPMTEGKNLSDTDDRNKESERYRWQEERIWVIPMTERKNLSDTDTERKNLSHTNGRKKESERYRWQKERIWAILMTKRPYSEVL